MSDFSDSLWEVKNYRPLLLQEIGVRLPGVHIRRLRLNRHLPEVDFVAEHHHSFAQILCYLQGGGMMTVGGVEYQVLPSTMIHLPPRSVHAFQETAGRRPLCLVVDLEWRGAQKRGFSLARLSQSALGSIKQELSGLTRLADPGDAGCRMLVASTALRIVDVMFQSLEILPGRERVVPAFVKRYERLVNQQIGEVKSVGELAAQMGYQKDYLNRIFKQATGLTLREYRDGVLLRKAKRLLRENVKVQDAGERLGFADQNYFARWFKKHTGMPPGAFKG